MNESLTMLDHALRLHGQGHHVIPLGKCREKPPSWFRKRHKNIRAALSAWPKAPRLSKWRQYQTEQPTEEQIEQWWTENPEANIGLLTGITVNVVDCDGEEAADWVRENLPSTQLTVGTASGVHFYFDAKQDIRNSATEGKGIDVRGVGGYVVAAGSVHSTGVVYTEEVALGIPYNDHTDLPVLNTEHIAQIKAANKAHFVKKPDSKDRKGPFFSREQIPKERGSSVGEGSRNVTLTQEAGRCYHDGMTLEDTLEECLDINSRYMPPMEYEEVVRIVESVKETRENRTGLAVPTKLEEIKKVKSMLFSFGDMEDAPEAEPEMFWHERAIFRGSRCLLAGEPKIGKSRFMLSMLCAAATGTRFLTHDFLRPYKVAWIQGEIHKSWLPERVDAVTKHFTENEKILLRKNLLMTGRLQEDLMSRLSRKRIMKALEQHSPDIVVFDPIAQLSTAEENSNKEVSALLNHINDFVKELNCACFIVHHTKQAEKGATPDFTLVRGASAFRGWFDTGILMTGKAKTPVISFEIRNGASIPSMSANFVENEGFYKPSMSSFSETSSTGRRLLEENIGMVRAIISGAGSRGITRDELDERIADDLQLDNREASRLIKNYCIKYKHQAEYDEATKKQTFKIEQTMTTEIEHDD